MLSGNVIVIATNSLYADGCDYAVETAEVLAGKNAVYVLLLGDPVSLPELLAGKGLPRRFLKNGICFLRPLLCIPGNRFALVKRLNFGLNAALLRLSLAVRYVRLPKVLWFFEPGNVPPVYTACRGYVSVYDCVDDFSEFGDRWKRDSGFLLSRADVVVASSAPLVTYMRKTRPDAGLVPAGFARGLFAGRTNGMRRKKGAPVAGYVGAVNDRLDVPYLVELVRRLPGVRFVFAGAMQQEGNAALRTLFAYPNVTYIGEIPKRRVPGLIRRFDVGLVPYHTRSRFNRHSYPMKTFEYLYCGKPVVSTGLVSLTRLRPYVRIAKTAADAANAVRVLVRKPVPEAVRRAMRRRAEENSWERKIEAISLYFGGEPMRS